MPTPNEKAMIKAAKTGDIAKLNELLDSDPALTNARDTDGSTPLHCASWKGIVPVVELLLKRGAEVNATNQNDHWGDTPLHAAAHGNQKAVAELLIANGADVNRVSAYGRTPLQETEFHKATSVAKLLKEHGAKA